MLVGSAPLGCVVSLTLEVVAQVVDQLKKEPFHPRKDYLDMMMQFG